MSVEPAATALEVAADHSLLRFAAEHMWRWLLLLALALHLCRTSALRIHTTTTRRAAIGCACTIGTACAARAATAYDSIPVDAGPDPAEAVRLRKQREARAAAKNSEVRPLLKTVSKATPAAEYNDAMAALTVWIIGTGPPIPNDCSTFGCTYAGPLPEGFRTRELIATCREVLDELPRIRQEVGTYMVGVGRVCEKTRSYDFCLSAGALAESAFKSMLDELKQRAPRQYDTPYGPVAF